MGRSQETFNKKDVRNKKEKKRKDKEKKRLARKEQKASGESNDDMIAYVDEYGRITDTPPDPTAKKIEVDLEDIEISVPKQDKSIEDDPVKKGTVSFFNDSKGYGFIRESITKDSVFVHINDLIDEIKEGNAVSFEIGQGPKGPVAKQVRLVK